MINSPNNGLKDVPAKQVRKLTTTAECVGYGKLRLPDEPTVDAILVKYTETENNKYYLGGTLAPDALLLQFGIVNDQTFTTNYYRFMSKELGGDAAYFGTGSGGNFAEYKKRK